MVKSIAIIILINFWISVAICSPPANPVEFPYNSTGIVVDGKTGDWKYYVKTTFSDTLSKMHGYSGHQLMAFYDGNFDYSGIWGPLSQNSVETRICWDLNNLYIAFLVNDEHLFAQMKPGGKYSQLHLNDGIEVYLDTKLDSDSMMDINDYQFLIDCLGQNIIFRGDLNMIKSDTMVAPKESGQNIYFEFATSVNGTLNDSLPDKGFVVEMAIPFTAIGLKPFSGMKMSMDLCNNDNDYSLEGVVTYEDKSLRYWPFNWSGYSDFGYPETWRIIALAGEPGWMDKLSGSVIRKWLTGYLSFLAGTVIIIVFLMLRMRRMKRFPAQAEINPSKVVFLEKHEMMVPELSSNQQILKKAADILTQNRQENIGSERLAGELGVSIRTLQRITKDELNLTPTNFIYLVKLNLAAEFLKNHLGNVSETAYEFGFSDPGYFSKLFKKHFGVSPLEYLDKNDNPS